MPDDQLVNFQVRSFEFQDKKMTSKHGDTDDTEQRLSGLEMLSS